MNDAGRTMRASVIWAIRDCRRLNAAQKAFLYTIESRGVTYGRFDTVAGDVGMKKDAFYAHRSRLIGMGVLEATERPGGTTRYAVNAEWFETSAPTDSPEHTQPSAKSGCPARQSGTSGESAGPPAAFPEDVSGSSRMKENHEGDPRRGPQGRPKRVGDLGPYSPLDLEQISAGLPKLLRASDFPAFTGEEIRAIAADCDSEAA